MLPAGQFGWLWVGLQQIVETGIVVIVLRKLGVHSGLGVKMGSCSSHEETWEASKRQEFSHPLCWQLCLVRHGTDRLGSHADLRDPVEGRRGRRACARRELAASGDLQSGMDGAEIGADHMKRRCEGS